MDLTIIIVNYNVRHFLEQCLDSVASASINLETEIFVVDNNSVDGSVAMVREKFPEVNLMANRENLGFAKANNQAIREAKGKYILLLNPDTVINNDALKTCFDFMEEKSNAGAVGLKMIDGKGKYLPESKRALPTPAVALYKFIGLSKLFPSSRRFNHYYLGNLDPGCIHEIEVLTGAFMFIRASALDKCGLLDESFFMYAEDIDLSHRLSLAGYKLFYLPEPPIIHYKGESTKKHGFNYPMHFYGSMIGFVSKYYKGRKVALLSWLLKLAIIIRAFLSILKRTFRKVLFPLSDIVLLYSCMLISFRLWENYKFNSLSSYPDSLRLIALPLAVMIVVVLIALFGGYRKKIRIRNTLAGTLAASLLIILIYSFLPLSARYSRAILLIWVFLIPLVTFTARFILAVLGFREVNDFYKKYKKIIIVSSEEDFNQISAIVKGSDSSHVVMGRISPVNKPASGCLGTLDQLDEIIRVNRPGEIIFSTGSMKISDIISIIGKQSLSGIDKKIADGKTQFMVGSNSRTRNGEVYSLSVVKKTAY